MRRDKTKKDALTGYFEHRLINDMKKSAINQITKEQKSSKTSSIPNELSLLYKEKRPNFLSPFFESGGDLLSRAVSSQVPSALKVLTSVFGMGTGGTPSPLPPEIVSSFSAP